MLVLVRIPYVYAVPGTRLDDPMWYGAVLEHEPRVMERQGLSFAFAPASAGTGFGHSPPRAFVAEGRFWIEANPDAVAARWEDRLSVHLEEISQMKRVATPLAGIDAAFFQKGSIVPIAVDGVHERLPARIAAEAAAREIASRTAVVDGRLHTSSYEPFVALTHPVKSLAQEALALKDVHGLWRHPSLRVLSPYKRAPFVPLKAALDDPDLVPWSNGLLGVSIPGGALDGFVPTISEADTVCRDVLRDAVEAVREAVRASTAVDDATWRTIEDAERMLDVYEDMAAPPPSFEDARSVLGDLFGVVRERSAFGVVAGTSKIGLRRVVEDFSRWYDLRGSRIASPPPETVEYAEDAEAVASFRM